MRRRMVSNHRAAGLMAVALLVVVASMLSGQQSGSSTSYFLPGSERAPGGQCASTNYRLELAVGAGAVAQLSTSTNFKLLGGFNAVSQTPIAGHPWLSGALPRYGPFLGGTTHVLHGHELSLGASTSVTIGGKPAVVLSRARDQAVVKLPAQAAPGWQPATATNSGGTTHLSPRGVGILPMAELGWAIDIGQPFRVTYRGTRGDIIYVAAAGAKFPFPVPVPPYRYGLELNLGALLLLVGPLPVTAPSGELHLDFPGFPFVRPIYVQFLSLPVGSPGYEPGCSTNTIAR